MSKAVKIDSLLAAEQRDVVVRHAEFYGIAQKGDSVPRIGRKLLEGPENPVPFDREEGLRQAHVNEDARTTVLDACQHHGTKKRACFFSGFPLEQVCSQKAAFDRDLVLHAPKVRPARASPLPPSTPPLGPAALDLSGKRPRVTIICIIP